MFYADVGAIYDDMYLDMGICVHICPSAMTLKVA